MITTEEYLKNTTEEELFALFHSFLFRLLEINALECEGRTTQHDGQHIILDKEIKLICSQIIREQEVKNDRY